jgi:cytochrome c-type biogenesis protein CcmE
MSTTQDPHRGASTQDATALAADPSTERSGDEFPGAQAMASRRRSTKRKLVVVALVLAGAIGFLFYKGIGSALNYYETVSQAVASRAQLGTSVFRLEGAVVPGSLHETGSALSFSLQSNGVTQAVIDHGSPPQLFRPGVHVVLVGHFQGRYFVSNRIMVKHSANYIAEHPNRVPRTSAPLKRHP